MAVTALPAHAVGLTWKNPSETRWAGDLAATNAARQPEGVAIHFADRDLALTWAELDRRADAFAQQMRERGLGAGDRVAWLGKNSDLFFIALFGAIRANVVLVSINWRLAVPEVAYILGDSGAKLVMRDPELGPVIAAAMVDLPAPLAVLPTEAESGSPGLRALLEAPAPKVAVPHVAQQVILQLYTSGTTGMPKGVLLTHGCFTGGVRVHRELDEWVTWKPGSCVLNVLPNFHIAGVAWPMIAFDRGAPLVLSADPSPANIIRLGSRFGAGHLFVVPTVIRGIVDHLKANPGLRFGLDSIHYGAAPIGESLLTEAMQVLGCEFAQHFGMTEVTGSCTFMAPSEHDPAHRPQLLASVGRPLPGCEIQIRGAEDAKLLERGAFGEIWVKSPMVMQGYWNRPDKTAEALVDGWYRSGDGGYMDAEGFLYLTDRIKDMIISGGENVYPNEVEEALRQHPAVLDAGVIGVPDDKWGEAVAALVELRPGQEVDEETLRRFARERIAGFKCPRTLRFGPLPRTASGKVQRANIRKAFRQ